MFGKKESIKFRGRKKSVRGLFSLFIGILVFIGFIVLSVISSQSRGNGGLILGAVAVLCFFAAIIGFILGYRGMKEKDIYFTAPLLGIILNGIMFILYMSLYIIGVLEFINS